MSPKSTRNKHIYNKQSVPPRQLVPSLLNRRRLILKKILNRYMGLPFTQEIPPLWIDDIIEAGLGDILQEVKQQLLPQKKLSPEVEPVAIEVRGVAVAFDEEISFTNYRFQTLQSPLYKLPFLPKLERYHDYCLYWGEIIGQEESADIGQILRRQAMIDFMQDMLPVVQHVPLLRLSVYDQFSDGNKVRSLHEILSEEDEPFYLHVADFIAEELNRIDAYFNPA